MINRTSTGVRQIAVTGILLVFLCDLDPLWQGKMIATKAASHQGSTKGSLI